jgi:hypothetical protein
VQDHSLLAGERIQLLAFPSYREPFYIDLILENGHHQMLNVLRQYIGSDTISCNNTIKASNYSSLGPGDWGTSFFGSSVSLWSDVNNHMASTRVSID